MERTRGDSYPYSSSHSYANPYTNFDIHPHPDYGSGTGVGGFVNTLSP